jgi:hypothetical protein
LYQAGRKLQEKNNNFYTFFGPLYPSNYLRNRSDGDLPIPASGLLRQMTFFARSSKQFTGMIAWTPGLTGGAAASELD